MPIEQFSHICTQPFSLPALRVYSCNAVLAEAESKHELGQWRNRNQGALVVIAVIERHMTDGFDQQGIERIASEVGVQRANISPDVRISRAKARDVVIAERILNRASGIRRG